MKTLQDYIKLADGFHRDGTLLYTLKHAGWKKGIEQFENATTIKVHGDVADQMTSMIQSLPAMAEALIEAEEALQMVQELIQSVKHTDAVDTLDAADSWINKALAQIQDLNGEHA